LAYYALGHVLAKQQKQGAAEAAYRQALSLQPDFFTAHVNLGNVLNNQQKYAAAEAAYRQALSLRPDVAPAWNNLANTLSRQGKYAAAEAAYRQALTLQPDFALAYTNFGTTLLHQGKHGEAVEPLQQAVLLKPKDMGTTKLLCCALVGLGRGEEARAACRQALDANLPEPTAWSGYLELCLFLGQEDEYRRVRTALLGRFGTTADPLIAQRTGWACLLLPGAEDELRTACALAERAAAPGLPNDARARSYFLFGKGLADYRRGRLDSAISLLEREASGVLAPAAGFVLAMARYRHGQSDAARKAFVAAVLVRDWSAARTEEADIWLFQVLRREAEATILPNLPAFLRGNYQPEQNDERLALLAAQLAICEFQGLRGSAARVYSDIFIAEPRLAEATAKGNRFYAARAAALAGCGQGKDADQLDDKERARWRRQALDWLRQDLTWWVEALARGNAQTRADVRWRMVYWQADSDLAGVRARDALARLPDEEREQWERLWSDVDALLRRVSEPE
jgi:serine/threonine-protein kinase